METVKAVPQNMKWIPETMEEFGARQPGKPVKLPELGIYMWPNGANSNGTGHSEAPEEPERIRNFRLMYLREKLRLATREYRSVQSEIANQIEFYAHDAGDSPNDRMPGWEEFLNKKSKEIEAMQNEIALLKFGNPSERTFQAKVAKSYNNAQSAERIARTFSQYPSYATDSDGDGEVNM
jgi:hypothetical protein